MACPLFVRSFNKAFYYSEHGEYENAIAAYNALIEKKPDVYELYVNKAIMLANIEKYDEAISTFEEAEKLNSNDPELYYNMAYLYESMGNSEMYQQYFGKGISVEFENETGISVVED